MNNEQKTVQSGPKTAKSWANLVSIVLSVLAFGFLFLTLLKFKDAAGEKSYLHIWDVFGAGQFQFMFVIGYALLVVSVPLLIAAFVFEKKGSAISTAASASQFLAAIAFVLTPMMYCNSMGGKSCTMEIGLALAFAFALAASLFSFIYAFSKMPMTVHDIAEDAILIAAAFALNFAKIPVPWAFTGGSINFQMLPLFIIALRHGPLHGVVAGGLVYGLLTCFTEGYGFATYPFDYLIGFGSVAVLGFFKPLIMGKNQKSYNVMGEIFLALGVILATFVRLAGGTASSMVIYEYNFVDALLYNLTYVPASGVIALAVLMLLYGPLLRVNKLLPAKEERN